MNAQLLVTLLQELEEAVVSEDYSVLIRASGTLRLLLTDGTGPFFRKFQGHKQVRFLVAESAFVDVGPNRFVQSLNPNAFVFPPRTKSLTLEQFLAMPLASIGTHRWTVKSHIRYGAHVLGGVHAGNPDPKDDPGQPEFDALKHDYLMRGHDITGYYLRQIAAIVLRALRPLRESVESIEQFENAPGIATYSVLAFHKAAKYPSFIFDFGTSEHEGRVSLFMEEGNVLRLRVRHMASEWNVRTGLLSTGFPLLVAFDVVSVNNRTLIALHLGDTSLHRVIPGNHAFPGQYAPHAMVLGSDFDGESHSYFDFFTHVSLPTSKTKAERIEFFRLLTEHFLEHERRVLRFRGAQFLVNNKHTRPSLQRCIAGKNGPDTREELVQMHRDARPRKPELLR